MYLKCFRPPYPVLLVFGLLYGPLTLGRSHLIIFIGHHLLCFHRLDHLPFDLFFLRTLILGEFFAIFTDLGLPTLLLQCQKLILSLICESLQPLLYASWSLLKE